MLERTPTVGSSGKLLLRDPMRFHVSEDGVVDRLVGIIFAIIMEAV